MKVYQTIRRLTGTTGVILSFFLILSFSCIQDSEKSISTEIVWDTYGVPHIYAQNAEDMYYAYGWAQMHNHADLILKLYAQSRGRAAEYWGEEFLLSDEKVQLFNLAEKAEKIYSAQNRDFKNYLDAFVKGINEYAVKNPSAINETARLVLPVTVTDIISHTLRITCLEFLAGEDIYAAWKSSDAGSNAIAIAPSKSASGNAMLIINPHLPWSDYFLWFEAHLNTTGFKAYGVSLIGMPSVTMAFNDNLGWAHTVNPIDASDRYELTLKGENYILDGKSVPFEKRNTTIKVLQKNGEYLEKNYEFLYSQHGPVIGKNKDKAYAVRVAGLDNTKIFEQYHKMAAATNFSEFEEASKMIQNPMFNVIYADKEGNIFYLFNGNVPVRNEGDFGFWRGTVDGTKSKYIWQSTHPYSDLPKVLNPTTGFLQNCNDPPWSCTFPAALNKSDFPAYMSTVGTPFRPQRSVNMIKNNPSVSFDQLVQYKLNTEMETAHRFLDDLLAAVELYPGEISLKAASVLKSWDKSTDNESRGSVLFACWWDKVRSNMFQIPWKYEEPVTTPDGLSNPKQAVELLEKAAQEVIQKYGSLDIAWGEVYRFRLNGMDYPANGGPGDYGIFRTMYFADGADNKKFSVAGETFIAVVEFGDEVKAEVILSYGNATQPGNKHHGDQLKMMSEKKLRPALLNKNDIVKNAESIEKLTPVFE